MTEATETAEARASERYEIDDVLDRTGPETRLAARVAGIVIVVALLVLALGYSIYKGKDYLAEVFG